jgi:hypothetical protein
MVLDGSKLFIGHIRTDQHTHPYRLGVLVLEFQAVFQCPLLRFQLKDPRPDHATVPGNRHFDP